MHYLYILDFATGIPTCYLIDMADTTSCELEDIVTALGHRLSDCDYMLTRRRLEMGGAFALFPNLQDFNRAHGVIDPTQIPDVDWYTLKDLKRRTTVHELPDGALLVAKL